MTLVLNETLDGKYRIIRLLGEGGMGAVYEGENVRIHRKVAIKVLHAGVASSKEAVERFEREAQAAGRIGSDHIVEVLDLGHLPSGDRYMVMEFLEGESLAQRLEAVGRLEPPHAADVLLELLEGLGAAHEAGIIHRDLKPDNVFLLKSRRGRKDFVKLVDFGISKFSPGNGGDFSMTRTGTVMGTPYYMAPEQAKGDRATDHRADLYAAGVILYEALSGSVPFDAETYNELLFKILLETPPPLGERSPGLDLRLEAIVTKAMARQPEERFQSAGEFAQALTDYLQTVPAESRRSAALGVTMAVPTAREPRRDGNTHGAWANTNTANPSAANPSAAAPRAFSPWLWGALGGLGLAAGLGFVLRSGVVGGNDARATGPEEGSAAPAPAAAPAPSPAQAPPPQAPPASESAQPGLPSPPSVGSNDSPAPAARPRPSAAKRAPRAPSVASSPSGATKGAPASPKSTTSGGRVIRTTL